MKGNLTEAELLAALRQGGMAKERAIKKFFYDDPTLKNEVIKFVLRHGGSSDDAKDVFHDAIIYFLKKIADEKLKDENKAKPYFMRIAQNTWFMLFRKKRNIAPELADEPWRDDDDLEEMAQQEQLNMALDYGLNQLEERQREMLKAKYVDDLSLKEITAKFSLANEEIAKKYLYRFKGYLRKHIKKHPLYPKMVEGD